MALFETKGISISIGKHTIVRDASFKIDAPFFLAVLGNNGSGKSTFLNAIAGLTPYQGEIRRNDQLVSSIDVGYLQQHNTSYFSFTSRELALMGRYNQRSWMNAYNHVDHDLVDMWFEKIGISHLLHQQVHTLSGGELQWVWIIQTIITGRPLLLFDEPSQHLDIRNKQILYQTLSELPTSTQQSICCVTHDIDLLSSLDGKLLNFSGDKQIHDISPESIQREKITLLGA